MIIAPASHCIDPRIGGIWEMGLSSREATATPKSGAFPLVEQRLTWAQPTVYIKLRVKFAYRLLALSVRGIMVVHMRVFSLTAMSATMMATPHWFDLLRFSAAAGIPELTSSR